MKSNTEKNMFFPAYAPYATCTATSLLCVADLKGREIILHCVSVSNQLQQCTNFCTNFSPKRWGEWGTRPPPCRKKWEDAASLPPHPRPTTPLGPDLQNILRQSHDNAKVTIDLRRTSHSYNVLRRTQGFSQLQFTCIIVKSSEIVFTH